MADLIVMAALPSSWPAPTDHLCRWTITFAPF